MKTENVKFKTIDDEQVAYAIINRKRYNTGTSELLATYSQGYSGDFKMFVEELYITKKGTFFLYAFGGPMSMYAEYSLDGGSYYVSGNMIQVMTPEEAYEWAENRGEYGVIDSHFSDQIEEA